MIVEALHLIFLIHLMFNLERYMLVNELLACAGLYFYVKRISLYIRWKQNSLLLAINFSLIYGFVYALASLLFFRDGTVYQYIRTLPLYYSIFAFFLGVEFVRHSEYAVLYPKFVHKYRRLLAVANIFIGGRLSNHSLIPLLLSNQTRHRYAFFFLLLLTTAYKRGITSYVIFGCYLMFLLFRNKHLILKIFLNKYVIFVSLGCFFVILYYVNNEFSAFYKQGFAFFTDYKMLHANVLWRMMFWSYEFATNIVHNLLFGIGFGTKLFDANDPLTSFLTNANPDDPNYEYTLGTHNSFLFILIRLGLLGLVPVLTMYFYFFRQITRNKVLQHPLVASSGLAFLFITLAALFNVVIESPLYASIYWAIMGVFYQSIQKVLLERRAA